MEGAKKASTRPRRRKRRCPSKFYSAPEFSASMEFDVI
jgi:hypothetical protein